MCLMKNDIHSCCGILPLFVLALLLVLPAWIMAAPPDLIAIGQANWSTYFTTNTSVNLAGYQQTPARTYNLGPTGMRGWIYCSVNGNNRLSNLQTIGQEGLITFESRQILVTVVGANTPAAGILASNDVILGVSVGTGMPVTNFTNDARKAFGWAITAAEAGDGVMNFKRWRAGTTTTASITLPTLGAYAATAPYDCPKSALILSNACTKFVSQLLADSNFLTSDIGGAVSGLALLASVTPDNPKYGVVQARLQAFARSVAPPTLVLTNGVHWNWEYFNTWNLGYLNLFLCEYYQSTGDASVLPGINQYTLALAQAQSCYGTFGHSGSALKADGSLHGSIPPYGPVNSAGIPANMSIVMGKQALLAGGRPIDPEIDNAIFRADNFFSWYVNKGNINYGEHAPYVTYQTYGLYSPCYGHASVGKNDMCALLFGLQTNWTAAAQYFTRMALAGYNAREYGHGGNQGFSYLWGALAANVGGTNALASYLAQVRWHLDLVRRTDGSFTMDGQEQYGPGATLDGTYLGGCDWAFYSTATYILTYALPLQRLYLTGKNANPANTLDTKTVTNAIAAGTFLWTCTNYTTSQLISALAEYDPVVRQYAVNELDKRTLFPSDITNLIALAEGTNVNQRQGACLVLGYRQNASALPALGRRLSDSNLWVRAQAAMALYNNNGNNSSSGFTWAKSQVPTMLTAFSNNATDPFAIYNNTTNPSNADWSDPVGIANGYLSMALFYGGLEATALTNSKSVLYPAIKMALKLPSGADRQWIWDVIENKLTQADVPPLMPDLIQACTTVCPANTMYGDVSRHISIDLLSKYHFIEGIQLALGMETLPMPINMSYQPYLLPGLSALTNYGDAARWTLPTLRGCYSSWDSTQPEYSLLCSALSSTIVSIENATTSPTLLPGLPVAYSQVVTTTNSKAITLTGYDGASNSLAYAILTSPAHGTLSGIPPNLTYTPSANYVGLDRFTFQTSTLISTSAPGTVSLLVWMPAGTGLLGSYYTNLNFTGLKLTRTDTNVNFNWGTSAPAAGMPTTNYSVRWTGLLLAPETTNYMFSTLNSDGVNLYVNGVQVISDWGDHARHWTDGTPIALTAGQKYVVEMDYYEKTRDAVAKLKWTGPSFAGLNGAIIDQPWLYDGTGVTNLPVFAYPQSVTMLQNTNLAITLFGSGGTNMTYTISTSPTHGTLTGTAPILTYTPAANYSGSDSFTFYVNNGVSNSVPATISIGIWAGQPVSFSWKNPVSGNWSAAANWTNAVVPAAAGQPCYTLNFNPSGSYTVTNDLSNGFLLNQLNVAGAVTFAGANATAFSANGSILPQINQNSGNLATFNGPLNLAAMTTLGGAGFGQVTITNVISGAGGLTMNNFGTLQIASANNTYSGGTVINEGTLYVSVVSPSVTQPLGSGPITLNSNGTLTLDYVSVTNAVILNGGTIFSANGNGDTLSGPVTLNSSVTTAGWGWNFNGNISGTGGFILAGFNPRYDSQTWLALSGTNTSTGANYVNVGTLRCSKSVSLGAGPLSVSDGAFVYLNYTGTRTIAALTLGGTNKPFGVYGSSSSPAANKDPHFAGSGTVTVAPSVSVTNFLAAGITSTSATLNAALGCGGTNAAVYAHWNTVNGGTSTAAWTNSVYLGAWMNVASTNLSCAVTGLTPNTTYYFTFRGTNAGGNVWPVNVQGFTTLASLPPPPPLLPGSAITVSAGVATFHFATASGFKYRLAYKAALTDLSWQPVIAPPTFPPPGGWSVVSTGAPMWLADTNTAGQPQRFYRLEAANP